MSLTLDSEVLDEAEKIMHFPVRNKLASFLVDMDKMSQLAWQRKLQEQGLLANCAVPPPELHC